MKVGIIGTGLVGATSAYALVLRKVASNIVLIDKDKKRAEAEASDIRHAIPFVSSAEIYAGDYPDLKGCKVIVIAAGVSQVPGETRLDLLGRNAGVLNAVIPEALKHAPDTILLMATNPVDVLTHLAARIASEYGLPKTKVIGSGTTLDTARFRALLGNHLGVDYQHVHGYVVGEHGDSEVLTWSNLDIAGLTLEQFIALQKIEFNETIKKTIDENVRSAAYHIIAGKHSTYYGIGGAIARITEVIGRDNRAILTICTHIEEIEGIEDVTLSLPHLVGGDGVLAQLPLKLDDQEASALKKSAQIIKSTIDKYLTTFK